MRRPAVVLAVAVLLAAPAAAQLREDLTVERVLVDVRVSIDDLLVRDLVPEDFEVRIGRKRAVVESATYVEDTPDEPAPGRPAEPAAEGMPVFPEGRLVVVFVQTDFARHASRMEGQMKFLQYAEQLLEPFGPRDRLAVFSFDSHLKFRLDFTSDKERVAEAMMETLRIDFPEAPPAVAEPSLARRLDRERMRRATSSETALRILGEAMSDIPGQKTLLLLGWGLGQRRGKAGVGMRPEWPSTRRALETARVSIIALDTTYADSHDLEAGLKVAAAETGGLYAKTHIFPEIAIQQVRGMVAGHYELELRTPAGRRAGAHDLDVRVVRKGATVYAPSVLNLSEP